MTYYAITENGYYLAIGKGVCEPESEITEQEYAKILRVIHNRPTPRDGYEYRLKTDLTWEEYEKPEPEPEPEADASPQDYEQALQQMGVNFNDEN